MQINNHMCKYFVFVDKFYFKNLNSVYLHVYKIVNIMLNIKTVAREINDTRQSFYLGHLKKFFY